MPAPPVRCRQDAIWNSGIPRRRCQQHQTDAGAHAYHIILLAKNQTGMTNLYRLVSEGHLNNFHRTPRMPRKLIENTARA